MVVAATGFFDGVHAGHRAVLGILKEKAKREGKESAVITFWPHPRNVLQQDAYALRLLNSLDEKRELILSFGIDHFIVVDFSREFSKLSTYSFLKDYLIDKYNVSSLIIGYDHKLGSATDQTQDELRGIATSLGIDTEVVDEVIKGGNMVSSTKIRRLLDCGNVVDANELLGYCYSLYGVVVSGNMLGRTIGFPTANMQLYEPLKLVPCNGVYYVKVKVLGDVYDGICNIGNRPTVCEGNQRTIETHILNFNDDIYGLDMKISFIHRIREERKFTSMDMLKAQINIDKGNIRYI